MEQTTTYQTSGEIIAIHDKEEYPSGFSKREFVLKVANGKYEQELKMELHKDRADVLESFRVGDRANVTADVRGNKSSNGRYYINLVAWKLVKE